MPSSVSPEGNGKSVKPYDRLTVPARWDPTPWLCGVDLSQQTYRVANRLSLTECLKLLGRTDHARRLRIHIARASRVPGRLSLRLSRWRPRTRHLPCPV